MIQALLIRNFDAAISVRLMAAMASEDHWAMAFWPVASVGFVGLPMQGQVVWPGSALVLAAMHGVVAGLLALPNPAAAHSDPASP